MGAEVFEGTRFWPLFSKVSEVSGDSGETLEMLCNLGKSPDLLFRQVIKTMLDGFSPASSLQKGGSSPRENFRSTSKWGYGQARSLTSPQADGATGKRKARGARVASQTQVTSEDQILNWLWQ